MSLALRKNLTREPVAEERESKSRFSVPKLNLSAKSLTKFLKKPKKSPGQVTELKDLPDVRAADRHPDAPVRQPIFASSDLGVPLAESIKRFDQSEAGKEVAEPVKQSASPIVESDPLAGENVLDSVVEEASEPNQPEDHAQSKASSAAREDLSALSLAQLADRLEAGLRRLDILEMRERIVTPQGDSQTAPKPENTDSSAEVLEEPAPVAIPPLRSVESAAIDAQAGRQADMDAALKAALGTLEKMTAHR